MKKTFKIAAFVAAAMMGFGFVSCANDDAEDLGTLLIVKDYQEKKEAEAAAAAAAAKAASSSSATVATDSWDLSAATVGAFAISGYNGSKQKDSSGNAVKVNGKSVWSYIAGTAISSTADATYLTSDYSYAGASGNYTLTFSKYTGTGVGTTKADVTSDPAWATTTDEVSGPYFRAHASGALIKRDALKISDVKGNVKLTITWGVTTAKTTADRNLEVTVGDSGTPVETPITVNSKEASDYTVTFDGGEGTNVYIGASNEVFISSIKIESAN